jgi:hypothetical protein
MDHKRSRNQRIAHHARRTTMFRKLALAAVAAASLGAAALTPSAASAHGWGGWHGYHHHHHGGFYGPAFRVGFVGPGPGCYVTRRVMTPHGLRWRTFNRCY